jgi:hypothetical protein
MKIFEDYLEALQGIYDYFKYEEEWRVYPIEFRLDYYWKLEGDVVEFYDSLEAAKNEDGMHTYSNGTYGRGKTVYETDDYTAIQVDTMTDGNKFLAIYDNKKRIK